MKRVKKYIAVSPICSRRQRLKRLSIRLWNSYFVLFNRLKCEPSLRLDAWQPKKVWTLHWGRHRHLGLIPNITSNFVCIAMRCAGVRSFLAGERQPDAVCVSWRCSGGSFHRSALISPLHLQALCSYKHPQPTDLWCFCHCVYSEKSCKYVNFQTKRTRMNNELRD